MLRNKLKGRFQDLQSVIVLVVIFALMAAFLDNFFTGRNLTNLFKQLAINLMLAASFAHLKICGEVDISFGMTMGFSTMCLAKILIATQNILLAFAASIAIGLAVGLFNGLIIVKANLPAFIVTYGTQMMLYGLTLIISKGNVLSGFPDSFRFFGQGTLLGVPTLFFFVLLTYVFWYFWIHRSKYGLQAYAVGNNRAAAALSGTNVDWVRIRAFVMHSVNAGFCGFLMLSRLMAAQSDVGSGLDFEVLSACIVGGISFAGGEGNVFMAIIGVFIVGLIRNFINLAHVNAFWNSFVTGAIIVLAMLADSLRKYLKKKSEENFYLNKRGDKVSAEKTEK